MSSFNTSYFDITEATFTPDLKTLTTTGTIAEVEFVVNDDGYVLKVGDKYMYTTGKNKIYLKESGTTASVSFKDNNVIIKFGTLGQFQYNANPSSLRFAPYTSSQTAISLYKIDDGAIDVPTLGDIIVTLPDGSKTVENGNHEITIGQSIKASATNAASIKIEASHEDGSSYQLNEGTWTPEKTGKHSVKVSATLGDDTKEHTFTLNVKEASIIESPDQNIVFTAAKQGWAEYVAAEKTNTWISEEGVNFYTSVVIHGSTYPRISTDGLRVYGSADNQITVSAPADHKITAIKIQAKSNGTQQGPAIIEGSDKKELNGTYGASTVEEFTYSFTEPVESFILGANNNNKNYAIDNMTISLDKVVELVAPQLITTDAGVTLTVAKGELYIKIENESVTNENAPRRANINSSNYVDYADYTKVDGNLASIEKPSNGSILIYAQARYYGKTAEGQFYRLKADGTVTGVEDITVDDENGEAVYYNMQGVRVAYPAAGGLYIKVQGKKATKVLVK